MEKRYGLPTAISMVIGIVIGSGVFIQGGKVLSLTGGNMMQGIAVVGTLGLICLICSLVFAELGSRYEKVNGVVDYAEVALGPGYAYYVGWFMATIYTSAMALGTEAVRGNDLGVSWMILAGSAGGILTPTAVGFVAQRAGIQAGMGVVVAMTVFLLVTIVYSTFTKGED